MFRMDTWHTLKPGKKWRIRVTAGKVLVWFPRGTNITPAYLQGTQKCWSPSSRIPRWRRHLAQLWRRKRDYSVAQLRKSVAWASPGIDKSPVARISRACSFRTCPWRWGSKAPLFQIELSFGLPPILRIEVCGRIGDPDLFAVCQLLCCGTVATGPGWDGSAGQGVSLSFIPQRYIPQWYLGKISRSHGFWWC